MDEEFRQIYKELEEVTIGLAEAAHNHPRIAFEARDLAGVPDMNGAEAASQIYRLVPSASSLWHEAEDYLMANSEPPHEKLDERQDFSEFQLDYQKIERILGEVSEDIYRAFGYNLIEQPEYTDAVSRPGSPVIEPAE